MRAIDQGLKAALFITGEPHVDRLATYPELPRHLGDGESIPDNAEHGVITLFHLDLAELH